MNKKIRALAAAITEKEDYFMLAHRAGNKMLSTIYLHELEGLKQAFEIVAGETYNDYFIRTLDE